MTDVVVPDVPDDVLAALDARAARLGITREQLLQRRLAQEASVASGVVTAEHLRQLAATFADLGDETVMRGAWG